MSRGIVRLRSLRGWVSPLFVGLALFFLVRHIVLNWQQVFPLVQRIRLDYLVLAAVLTLAMQLLMPVGWRLSLRWAGSPMSALDAFTTYYRSSIFRYVPGSLWYLPTRAILAQACGVPLRAFTAGSILELAFLLGVAGVLAGAALAAWSDRVGFLALSAVCLLGLTLLVASPAWLRRLILGGQPDHGSRLIVMQALLVYCGIWLTYGASLFALLLSFDVVAGFSFGDAAYVVAANAAAWTAGFLSFVPAGIGVREISLLGLFRTVAPAAPLLMISLVQRSIELLLEAGLWLAATLLSRAE
jgi:glycosyltransferase 2 family protein